MTIAATKPIAANAATGARRRSDHTAPQLFAVQSTTGPGSPLPKPMSDDFVDELQAILREHIKTTDETLKAIASAVRDRWGGDRPYIAKRPGEGRSERNATIRREFRRGDSVPLLARRHQLGRRQILRIVGLHDDEASA